MYQWTQPLAPLRIGIDIDGVLARFDRGAYQWMLDAQDGYLINPTEVGIPDESTHPRSWYWFQEYGFTRETEAAFWEMCRNDPAWWDTLALTSDVTAWATRWLNTHETYFITQRPREATAVTKDWLSRHGFTGTLLVAEPATKGLLAQGLGLHAMVDDNFQNLLGVLKACRVSCLPILIERPYNNWEGHAYIQRATTLSHAIDKIIDNTLEIQSC
jgi:uncharacterized HAD superfamily protein